MRRFLWWSCVLLFGYLLIGALAYADDIDADGMVDEWEVMMAVDNCPSPEVEDAEDDCDGDGWNNLAEFNAGTNPNNNGSFPVCLSGYVSAGDGAGNVIVVAESAQGTGTVTLAGTGFYTITNLPNRNAYVVTAFRDANANGIKDPSESVGLYARNPVYLERDRGVAMSTFNLAPFCAAVTDSSHLGGLEDSHVIEPKTDRACNVSEWAIDGQPTGWVQLDWSEPVVISRLLIHDRACDEQVVNGHVSFSDGGEDIPFGTLEDTGMVPADLVFTARTVTWLRVYIDESVGGNPGLNEVEVYGGYDVAAETNGLLAEWNFDEASGGEASVALGEGDGLLHGSLQNFADTSAQDSDPASGWTATQRAEGGGALRFDGSDDFVLVNHSELLSLTTSGTIEFWAYRASRVDYQMYLTKWASSDAPGYQLMDACCEGLAFRWGTDSDNLVSAYQSVPMPYQQWAHVVAVSDGQALNLFIDGQAAGTVEHATEVVPNEAPLLIGARSDGYYFNGLLDSVRLYHRPLTAAEAMAHFGVNLTIESTSVDDTDGDGMPDAWETAHGLDLEDPADAEGDLDEDGLSNLNEYEQTTDPQESDTDGDGLVDGDEVNDYGTNPLLVDTDGDGLTDGDEVDNYGTDPLLADTDDDGLTDGAEVNEHGTDPFLTDTDMDELPDGWEVAHALDPVNEADAGEDLDSDGLSNLDEYYTDSDPENADTDGDGLSDGEEVNNVGTDPLLADTDDDGLTDGAEVNEHGTDPFMTDTDMDELPDGWEVAHALDPVNEADAGDDLDSDGLSNLDEYYTNSDPENSDTDGDGLLDGAEVNDHGTDPLLADSDMDGMPDGWEVAHGLDPVNEADAGDDLDADGLSNIDEYMAHTDPENVDSDGDDLLDGDEVHQHGTDPLLADTDGDGRTDGKEIVDDGTDPLDPDSVIGGLFLDGRVVYSGRSTGDVVVLAGLRSLELNQAEAFKMSLTGDAYHALRAFLDLNSNGNQDAHEACGDYMGISSNSIYLDAPGGVAAYTETNIALIATVSYSACFDNSDQWSGTNVADGYISYGPWDARGQWALPGGSLPGWVKLEWPEPQVITHIRLFDRPGPDQVLRGTITFGDGSAPIRFGPLPDMNWDLDESMAKKSFAPMEFYIEPRTAMWVRVSVDEGSANSAPGYGEVEIYSPIPYGVDVGSGKLAVPSSETNGLVAEWRMDEGEGVVVAATRGLGVGLLDGTLFGFDDVSGWDADAASGWTTNGVRGKGALRFDGLDDYVEVADNDLLDLTHEATLEFWLWRGCDGCQYRQYLNKGDAFSVTEYEGSGRLLFRWEGSGNGFASSRKLPAGKWVHVACVYDGSWVRVYLDGVLDFRVEWTTDAQPNDQPLRIGARGPGSDPFAGRMDQVRIYNRALTEPEIMAHGSDAMIRLVDPDGDRDGMPDWWEQQFNLDDQDGSDGESDDDHDGLVNWEEYVYKTDPNAEDSDGDGLFDGAEVSGPRTDPAIADSDGDGLSDGEEANTWHTNPLRMDSDRDGMPDGWERSNGLDPLSGSDRLLDQDGDGLKNGEEYDHGCNPQDVDSDDDGMPDYWEVIHNLNPQADDAGADADGDGLSNLQEFQLGADPTILDSDEDGLQDGDEVHVHGTNPARFDTDGDGLSDGDEITRGTLPVNEDSDEDGMPDGWEVRFALDPSSADATDDADGDGLTNAEELEADTDPSMVDSDQDGLSDSQEVHTLHSDPLRVDSDGDGLSDAAEFNGTTSPSRSDTDNDGMGDGWELANVFDPLNPLDGAQDADGDGLTNAEEFQRQRGLSYWVESYDEGVRARIWIKVPQIAEQSAAQVFMLYGNTNATTLSSGEDVLEFYDDFSSARLKSGWSFWDPSGLDRYSLTERPGWLRIRVTGHRDTWGANANNAPFLLRTMPGGDYVVQTRQAGGEAVVGPRQQLLAWVRSFEREWWAKGFTGVQEGTQVMAAFDGYSIGESQETGTTNNFFRWRTDEGQLRPDWSADGVAWTAMSGWESGPGFGYTPTNWGLGAKSWCPCPFDADFDYFLVRKFVNPEPVVRFGATVEIVASEWSSMCPVVVTNSSDTILSDYQVLLVVESQPGMKPNFEDLRFCAALATDPNNPDCDGDELPDGWEVQHGLDPQDASDAQLDLDGDGAGNLAEYELGTDPTLVDTDQDGMDDGWEVVYGLDPLDAGDGTEDLDEDGLSNAQENAASRELDYWIEKTEPGVSAVVWVNVPQLAAHGTSTVFAMFRVTNAIEVSSSSGENTFTFFDDFSGTNLNAGWEFWNPGGDDDYTLTERPGWMRVKIQGISDSWGEMNQAPFLYRSVSEPGEYCVQTRMDSTNVFYERYQLLAWINSFASAPGNKGYIGINNRPWAGGYSLDGVSWMGAGWYDPIGSGNVHFRLKTVGDRIYGESSDDGSTWADRGYFTVADSPTNWGLGGRAWGAWNRGYSADFDYFLIRKTCAVEPVVGIGSVAQASGAWTRMAMVFITNQVASALTNYPVQMTIPWAEGMQEDFGDLRFFSSLASAPDQFDADGDELPDGWEVSHGLDPSNPADGALDADGDGLTNLQEYQLGTDLHDADSDDDGMPDGWEQQYGLDPLDPADATMDLDNDEFSNLQEFNLLTPLNYWMEESVTGEYAHIWVKIPELAARATTEIAAQFGFVSRVGSNDINGVMNPGLRYFYFNGANFETFKGTDIDTSTFHNETRLINSNSWEGGGSPISVRWEGWLINRGSGIHTFYLYSDDGSRLSVPASNLIHDHWGDCCREWSAQYSFDRPISVKMEWNETGGGANIFLGWQPADGSDKTTPIPLDYLRCRQYAGADPAMTTGAVRTLGLGSYALFFAASNSLATALTNYQIHVTVPYQAGMKLDFSDLRFSQDLSSNPTNADSDADGLADKWEFDQELNWWNPDDAAHDRDGDGLTNLEEFEHQTDLNRPDTDADGLSDGDEVSSNTDPLIQDTDLDGFKDGWEVLYGFNPLDDGEPDDIDDPDLDGLTNQEEHDLGTNPYSTDSDADGMPDAWEVEHSLNPALATDGATDSDADGLSSLREFLAGTDPNLDDSDADGLSDGYEVGYGTYVATNTTFNWVDITTNGTRMVWSGTYSYNVYKLGLPIGFDFSFFRNTYTNINFSGSGTLYFGPLQTYVYNAYNYCFPTADAYSPKNAIGAFVDMLSSNQNAQAYYLTRGSVGQREFIVTWMDFAHYNYPASRVTFQAILRELSNDVIVQYLNMTGSYANGTSAMLGLQNSNATEWVSYGCNQAVVSNELAICYSLTNRIDALTADSDGDGLTDGEEVLTWRTKPYLADSDGDGLTDSDEVTIYHSNPNVIDSDGDGFTDLDEATVYHTDPARADSDGDGLSDPFEVQTSLTSATDVDTDADSMPDGWEWHNRLSPTNAADALMDADSDGLRNMDEYVYALPLPYWVDNPGTNADVWVKMPILSARETSNTPSIVYMAYGNPAATNQSAMDDVMDQGLRYFFYDFRAPGYGEWYYQYNHWNKFRGTDIDLSPDHTWDGVPLYIRTNSWENPYGAQYPNSPGFAITIRWDGWIINRGVGPHVLYGTSSSGQTLYAPTNQTLFSKGDWYDDFPAWSEQSATQSLSRPISVRYQFYSCYSPVVARLGWEPADGSGKVYPIPSDYLRCRKYATQDPVVSRGGGEESISGDWSRRQLIVVSNAVTQILTNYQVKVTIPFDSDMQTNYADLRFSMGTMPRRADCDGDGLLDGAEVLTHLTNPWSADTDNDGMSDKWEVDNALDPRDPADAAMDPDGDAISNLVEFHAGTDPHMANFPPDRFSLLSPSLHAADEQHPVTLQWQSSSNLNGYVLYFGTNTDPSVYTNLTGTSLNLTNLLDHVTYHWYVLATNVFGTARAPATGTWAFTTAPSMAGMVSYSGPDMTGVLVLSASNMSGVATSHLASVAESGPYKIRNLETASDYALSALLDVNGNRQLDSWESWTAYTNNPVHVAQNVEGANLALVPHYLLTTTYTNSFAVMPGSEWGGSVRVASGRLGQMGNESVTLTLSNLPPHEILWLNYDLFLTGTWDAGSDTFGMSGDLANYWNFPSGYPGTPDLSGGSGDSTYRTYYGLDAVGTANGFQIQHTSDTFTVTFYGSGLHDYNCWLMGICWWNYEYWALDNLTVTLGSRMRVLQTVPPLFSTGTISSVDLVFGQPLDTTTIGLDDFRIISGSVTNPFSHFEFPTSNTCRLWLDTALTNDGSYILQAGPGLRSLYGAWMDQDGDRMGGETNEDQFRSTLILDQFDPSEPVVTNMLLPPSVNFVTNAVVLLRGTREDQTSIWAAGQLVAALGNGSWQGNMNLTQQGLNVVAITSRDAAGNDSSPVLLQYFLDSVPPTAGNFLPPDGSYVRLLQKPNTLSLDYVENGSGLNLAGCQMNVYRNGEVLNGSWSEEEGTLIFTGLISDGVYDLEIRLKDMAGWFSPTYYSSFTMDMTAPVPPQLTTYVPETPVAHQLLAGTKESFSDVRLNGDVIVALGGATNWTYDVPLTAGANTLNFSSVDRAGNTSSVTSIEIYYGDKPPGLVPVEINGAYDGTRASLAWTAYDEFLNGDDLDDYLIFQSGSSFVTTNEAQLVGHCEAGVKAFTATGLVRNATYYFAVLARDLAGNVLSNLVPANVVITDTVAPDPPGALSFECTHSNLLIRWGASANNAGDLAGYKLTRNSEVPGVSLGAGVTEYLWANLPPATGYVFRVTALDGSGNESGARSATGSTVLSNPTNVTPIALSRKVALTWSPVTPAAYVARYDIFVATNAFTTTGGRTPVYSIATTNGTVTGLTENVEYFFAVATVNVSGGSDTNVITVTAVPVVDADGPIVSNLMFNGQAVTNGLLITQTGTLAVAASDFSGVSRMQFLDNGMIFADQYLAATNYSAFWDINEVADGSHTLALAAYDTAGNMSTTTYSVVVALAPPGQATMITPSAGLVVNTPNLLVSGTTPPRSGVVIYRNGQLLGPAPVNLAGQFSTVISLVEGVNSVQIAATNRAGVGTLSSVVTVTYDNSLPPAPVSPTYVYRNDGSIQLDSRPVDDTPLGGFNVYRSPTPFTQPSEATRINNAPLASATFSDTPPAEGTYYYRVAALNAAGFEGALSDFTVITYDLTAPRASDVSFVPRGVYADEGPLRAGTGPLDVVFNVSEPLTVAPFVSFVPAGRVPIPLSAIQLSPTSYMATVYVDASIPSGHAQLTFSGRDASGNRGTSISGTSSVIIDTAGPSATNVVLIPSAPLENSSTNPLSITVVLQLNESPDASVPPQLVYAFSEIHATGHVALIDQSNGTWSAQFTLPSSAGIAVEDLILGIQAVDDLGNEGSQISGVNRFQVYQGTLPALLSPYSLVAESLAEGAIHLSWEAVEGASGYLLYRSAEGGGVLAALASITTTVYTDAPPSEGLFQYAVASLRSANGRTVTGEVSEVVSALSDNTPPLAPASVQAALSGRGVYINWSPSASSEPVRYDVYRSGSPITAPSNLVPVARRLVATNWIDVTPSATNHYYAIVARDAVGNGSVASPSAYLNAQLLPVSALSVTLTNGGYPTLGWTHAGGAGVSGYEVLVKGFAGWASAADSPVATSPWLDTQYGGGDRTYGVVAFDSNGYFSPTNEILFPSVRFGVDSSTTVQRGMINRLGYSVVNQSTQELRGVYLVSALGPITNRSPAFDLAPLATTRVETVLGGDASLSDRPKVHSTFIWSPFEGSVIRSSREQYVDAVAGALNAALQVGTMKRGTEGQVTWSLQNSGVTELDLITATEQGAADSPVIHINLRDTDGNLLSTASLRQSLGSQYLTLPSGDVVVRLATGATYRATSTDLLIPTNAPDQVVVELQIDNLYYHRGAIDETRIAGMVLRYPVSVMDVEYEGVVTNVTPRITTSSTPIVIQGYSYRVANGNPVAEQELKLILSDGSFERSFSVTSDLSGNFTYTYQPSPGESGTFGVRAVHPDVVSGFAEDSFVLRHFTYTPSTLNASLLREQSYTFTVNVTAGAGTSATNARIAYLAADQSGGTFNTNVQVQVGSPAVLNGTTAPLTFTLRGGPGATTGILRLRLMEDDDAVIGTITVNYDFVAANPLLSVSPSYVQAGVNSSNPVLAQVTLRNNGYATLNNLRLNLVKPDGSPAPGWLTLVSAEEISALGVGQGELVEIAIIPDSGVSYGDYVFYLRASADNHATILIPVYAAVTTSGMGDALFKVQDMYTGTQDAQGRLIDGVAHATVWMRNDDILSQEFTLETDTHGEVLFHNIPAGSYSYRVTAPQHQGTSGTIFVQPGNTVTREVSLQYDLVTIEWSVKEITIEDRYEIVLSATYETDVPAPVVTVSPALINVPPCNEKGATVQNGQFVLENHGLIKARDVSFSVPSGVRVPDAYLKTFDLEAKQQLVIPYTVTIPGCGGDLGEDVGSGGGTSGSGGSSTGGGTSTNTPDGGASTNAPDGGASTNQIPDGGSYSGGEGTSGDGADGYSPGGTSGGTGGSLMNTPRNCQNDTMVICYNYMCANGLFFNNCISFTVRYGGDCPKPGEGGTWTFAGWAGGGGYFTPGWTAMSRPLECKDTPMDNWRNRCDDCWNKGLSHTGRSPDVPSTSGRR